MSTLLKYAITKNTAKNYITTRFRQINPCLTSYLTDASQEDDQPILKSEVEAAIASRKSTGIDNIPGEMLKNGGDPTVEAYTKLRNEVWRTGL